eukprot:1157409-Pelagomonas_calceolata.AAC.7
MLKLGKWEADLSCKWRAERRLKFGGAACSCQLCEPCTLGNHCLYHVSTPVCACLCISRRAWASARFLSCKGAHSAYSMEVAGSKRSYCSAQAAGAQGHCVRWAHSSVSWRHEFRMAVYHGGMSILWRCIMEARKQINRFSGAGLKNKDKLIFREFLGGSTAELAERLQKPALAEVSEAPNTFHCCSFRPEGWCVSRVHMLNCIPKAYRACRAVHAVQGSGPFPSQEVPWPSPFGHRFYFAVTDTVTAGTEGSAEGSMEFLAFQRSVLCVLSCHITTGLNSSSVDSLIVSYLVFIFAFCAYILPAASFFTRLTVRSLLLLVKLDGSAQPWQWSEF